MAKGRWAAIPPHNSARPQIGAFLEALHQIVFGRTSYLQSLFSLSPIATAHLVFQRFSGSVLNYLLSGTFPPAHG